MNKIFAEKYLQGSFFDMILTYYVKYEIPAQIWSSFVENEKTKIFGVSTMDYFRDKYLRNWDNDAKKMQRIIWAVLLDFRNPYNGEKIKNIFHWMSLDLHHWMTGKGVENKYKSIFAALIPLPTSYYLSSFVHNDVTDSFHGLEGDEKIENGIYWENEFAKRLSAIFQGEFSMDWKVEAKMDFDIYRENTQNINARKLICWLLLNPYSNILKKVNINPSTL